MSDPELGSGPKNPTNTAHASNECDPIAIVGIGCRYADARGPEEFWEIVESEGWTSLGRARDFDWMHFQAPRLN